MKALPEHFSTKCFGREGFSLIEVIVSIFVLSVMLLLLQAVLRSGALVTSTRNQDAALTIARNEIEKLRAGGYSAIPSSGPFSNDLITTLPSGSAALVVGTFNEKTKQITATVSWQENNRPSSSSVSISTLITEIGGLQ